MRNIFPPVTDNIIEVLAIIIKFTQARQKILARNINHANTPGYVPKDLEVDVFSRLMSNAINEHIQSQRLVLYDTNTIKFGAGGTLETKPVIDEDARCLREKNLGKYLKLQTQKLQENSINYKVANELVKQKQGMLSIFK